MSTTIRVSIATAKKLEHLKKSLGMRSIEEVIIMLINERRKRIARKFFGIDKGKISSFTEEDRLDSRV